MVLWYTVHFCRGKNKVLFWNLSPDVLFGCNAKFWLLLLDHLLYPTTREWWGIMVLWYQDGCPCVHLYFHFWMVTWVNTNRFSPNLVYALTLWSTGLGQILTELSARDMFRNDNLSKNWWISTKWFVHSYYGDQVWDWSWELFISFCPQRVRIFVFRQ